MFRKSFAVPLMTLAVAALLAFPALAQDATEEATMEGMPPVPENAVLSGLNNPRGVAYDADGTLYVMEAGAGGAEVLMATDAGNIMSGFSSKVTTLSADGTQGVAVGGLFSLGTPEGEILGGMHVYPAGDSLWLVLSGAGPMPSPFYMDGVVEVEKATGHIVQWIDMYAYEAANNPDGNDIDSNVNDIGWSPDGTLYIVDTGANTLFAWGEEGLEVVQTWPDNPVPVAIEFAEDGSFYIGFLGAGLAPGAAKVEHWSADGELIETFGGLTTVTDIAIGQDGSVYAVQLLQFGEQGPMPGSGSVVMVNAEGATPVAEGLMFPYGLAQAPDGSWAVAVGSTFGPPGTGAVVIVGGGM